MKVEWDLFNCGTEEDLKNFIEGDTSSFTKKVDKLDIDKLKNVPTNLSNWKTKVDKLDVNKLIPVLLDLSELSDAVENDVVKKDVYNVKI